jgi:hypothetical protein
MIKPIVHLANTDIEFELAHFSSRSLEKNWHHYPLCLQLQFLPLLYAQPDEWVAVTQFPDRSYLEMLKNHPWFQHTLPQLTLIAQPQVPLSSCCQPWGHSPQVESWAKKNQINYTPPVPWEMIQTIHSKAFSFQFSSLPQAALISNEQELQVWLDQVCGPKVLKTCYGLSGQGHYRLEEEKSTSALLKFCTKEWRAQRPLIAEPWLDRVEDFSTQWIIHPSKEIEWLGSTRFETDEKGKYLGTWAGPESLLFPSLNSYLQAHKQKVYQALQMLAELNYFGPIGIDALIYRENNQLLLHAIVEINPRQTMSSVALHLQQRLAPHSSLRLSFSSQPLQTSFLPKQLFNEKGKTIEFRRHLTLEII